MGMQNGSKNEIWHKKILIHIYTGIQAYTVKKIACQN